MELVIVSRDKSELDPCILVVVAKISQRDLLLRQSCTLSVVLCGNSNHCGEVILAWDFLHDTASVVETLCAHAEAAAAHVPHILPVQGPLCDIV